MNLRDVLDLLLTTGTTECTCGGQRCPGTLARAAAAAAAKAEPFTPEDATKIIKKRRDFELELSKLINRLSLESHFGNMPDFKLARMAWEFLSNPRPEPMQAPNGYVGKPPEPSDSRMVSDFGMVSVPEFATSEKSAQKPSRRELINEMHAAATRLGYRIVDIAPIS